MLGENDSNLSITISEITQSLSPWRDQCFLSMPRVLVQGLSQSHGLPIVTVSYCPYPMQLSTACSTACLLCALCVHHLYPAIRSTIYGGILRLLYFIILYVQQ